MSNPNNAKGKEFERKVFRFLLELFGRLVRRPHNEGFNDVGDLHLSPFALQAKNWGNTTAALNEGLKGAELQARNAGELYGAVVIKKRNASIAEARVAMTLRTFAALIARLHSAEDALLHADPYRFDLHAAEHVTPKE